MIWSMSSRWSFSGPAYFYDNTAAAPLGLSPDVNTRESEARAAALLGGRSNPLVSFPAGMPKSVLSMLGQPSYTTKDKETHRPTAA